MSYTTRCPACGTMFKVVPDQLKISDGWVRCGHCADVFDATLYLETWVPPAPVPTPQPEPPPTPVLTPEPLPEPEPDQEPVSEWAAVQAPASSDVSIEPWPTVQAAEPEFDTPGFVAAEPWSPESTPTQVLIAEAQATEVPAPGIAAGPEPDALPEAAEPETASAVAPADEAADWLVAPESVSDAREQELLTVPAVWQAPLSGPESFAVLEPLAPAVPEQTEAPVALTSDLLLPAAVASAAEVVAQEPESDFQAELERFAAASSGAVRSIHNAAVPELPLHETVVDDPDAAQADEPGFVRQARRRAFWRSPLMRASLGALAVLLTLLLAAQWTLHERNRLAASQPELAPLLARLCEPLGCEIGPVRRIEAVVIDSSTLARRLGNFYAFDLVLKNNATLPVAVPALELSLTDTRDSVIARRVFLPQELPGNPKLLPAQGVLSVSLRLSIADSGAVPMAGYRALVFYP